MKKAVVIGITYDGELPGSANDVREIYHYLVNEAEFDPENIYVLLETDEGYEWDDEEDDEEDDEDEDEDDEDDEEDDEDEEEDDEEEYNEKKGKKDKKDKKKGKKDKKGKKKGKKDKKGKEKGKKKGKVNKRKLNNYVYESSFPAAYKDEDYPSSYAPPTRENILDAFDWLMDGVKAGDALFMYYGGHGGQIEDEDGDEADGWDETICPLDYEEEGEIIDDELHELLVDPLPAGVKFTVLFDCCNSGTAMDLPYYCQAQGPKFDKKGLKKHKEVLKVLKDESGRDGGRGLVVLFSGCPDGDCSADLVIDDQNCGILVNAFTGLLRNTDHNVTYYELLYSMRVVGKDNVGWVQIPQLSWNQERFDVETQFSWFL